MKKIYVQLESPWNYSSGGIGKDLIDRPPKGIEYISNVAKKIITTPSTIKKAKILKGLLRVISKVIPLTKSRYVKITDKKVLLLHCEHFLPKNKKITWVADFEGYWQFFIGKRDNLKLKKIKKILSRDKCKKIIFWTNSGRDAAQIHFPEHRNKFEIVFPAMTLNTKTKKFGKKITLIFVGRYFYLKGGLHALEAMDRLTKKYKNVEANFISDIPDEMKIKYSKNKK